MSRLVTISGTGEHATEAVRLWYRRFSAGSPLVLLLLWEILARVGALDVRFFPPPTAIARTFFSMILSGELMHHLAVSLGRIGLGFVVGAVPALGLGLTMGLFPLIRAWLEPIVYTLYPIPKLAIMPLVILVFGLGEPSKVAIIAIGVFFQVLINTVAGVVNIDRIYLDVARNLGARRLDVYRTVALPGALPMIFAGLHVALGTAFLLIVAAEFVGARSGLGFLIWNSWQLMQVDVMYSGVVTVALSGYLAATALKALERLVIPWRPLR